jgi:hypothetical protein
MKQPANSEPYASKAPTGDRADKHTKSAEPQQTPVSGDESESAANEALVDSTVTAGEVLDQSAYRGNEADVGQQAATSKRARNGSDPILHEDRG